MFTLALTAKCDPQALGEKQSYSRENKPGFHREGHICMQPVFIPYVMI